MTIMNYGDLQAAVADYAKRTDIGSRIPDFIQAAHVWLQEYVGPLDTMTYAADVNKLLQYDPYCYLYGAMVDAANYLRDDDMLQLYQPKFQEKLTNLAMTGFDAIRGSANTRHPI